LRPGAAGVAGKREADSDGTIVGHGARSGLGETTSKVGATTIPFWWQW